MAQYIIKRIIFMIPTLFIISILTFIIIQLPPGDFVSTMVANSAAQGQNIDAAEIQALRARYGLGQPVYVQYGKWVTGLLQGDLGFSYTFNEPARSLIMGRLGFTILISASALLMTWAIAFPIGIYSAVRKYSVGDYTFTLLGFLGLAIPDFLLALVMMYIAFKYFGQSVGGLFSEQYIDAPWSLAKLADLGSHLWIPMVIVGTAGTAGLIRILRANLLDELFKPYVITARSKGVSERRLLLRYPVRIALNPFISTIGWSLPALFSGETIVGVVLSLPTIGPLLLNALKAQDMYLAGSIILILSILTVIGTLISDILLAWNDPRIRYQ
ncbi:MAG TPA: ABC transporter permease [Thermomicrobiales bacterium]|jgi:peptide/nickel transport system permease protein|nr:ABC transporter permease [Thermomicrobiales bacterium]